MSETAIIIGAGPAGLTAASELLGRTDIKPTVLELSTYMGGLARTIDYKGNRIDIGGHRFFSKSDRVMDRWNDIMPIQGRAGSGSVDVSYQNKRRAIEMQPDGPDPEQQDVVMLVRSRLSRIYFLRKFFAYPIAVNLDTMTKLGPTRMVKIGASYLAARLRPRPEHSLEDFFINRFGTELYATFFRDYTEKIWGVPCTEIKPEWGAQRVKGLSITSVLVHALKSALARDTSIAQKGTETSLIEQFLYPKLGPGQMWDLVAEKVRKAGGEILTRRRVEGLSLDGDKITEVRAKNLETGNIERYGGDYIFSTMAIQDLMRGLEGQVPEAPRRVGEGLHTATS